MRARFLLLLAWLPLAAVEARPVDIATEHFGIVRVDAEGLGLILEMSEDVTALAVRVCPWYNRTPCAGWPRMVHEQTFRVGVSVVRVNADTCEVREVQLIPYERALPASLHDRTRRVRC